MDHVVQVTVVEGIRHLVGVLRRPRFIESMIGCATQVLEQLALGRNFQGQIDAALVVEPSEQAQDVRVLQSRLDLDLA